MQAMNGFSKTVRPQRDVCQQPLRFRALSSPRVHCQPRTPLQQQQHHYHQHQQKQLWSLRAAPDEDRAADTPPAAAAPVEQPNDSTPQQADVAPSAISNLAGSLGQKAFVSEEEWRVMDKKVNKYPSQRTFTAIGTGGDDFKDNMMKAVEDVVGTVHVECVSERPSSGGKYVSVRIGPVWVETADQVVQVFNNMREDKRLKWYM